MFDFPRTPVERTQEDPVTGRETLTVAALLVAVTCILVVASISLDDKPHGEQLAILIGYSGYVFVYTFFRTRGVPTRHGLGAAYVRRALPRLLLIHVAYLFVMFVLAGWALARRPQLPLRLTIFGAILIALSQVFVSRTLLSRAKRASWMVAE
jgi:hypothetical protein